MIFDAFHLPVSVADDGDVYTLRNGDASAVAPRLSAAGIADICSRLITARATLARMRVPRIIEAIAAAADALRDRSAAAYEPLVRGISAFTGYDPAMTDLVLQRMCDDWSPASLRRLIDVEFGGTDALDDFAIRDDGTRVRAVAPALGLHVFSGNVPGVGVGSIVRALLVKSAVLGKTAAGEPLLAPRFARLLAHCDPDVGACVAVTHWPGGDEALEAEALDHAGVVVHYGGAGAIASLRARAPARVNFLDHGPRVSIAVVDSPALAGSGADAVAADLARAVALFDQQGCVSPQVAWVIGREDTARELARRTAAALDAIRGRLPRGRIDPAEAAAIRELRTRAEFRAIAGDPVEIWTGDALAWTVVMDPTPAFSGSCLNRTLIVKHAASTDDLLRQIKPLASLLQTAGLAGFEPAAATAFAIALADAGVTRICAIADMPWPDVAWRHDGRGPLQELVRWTDWS